MIPLKLELANFLSYRDTAVLEFNGVHLACIAGANGAGKSSLLDAITWALFGRSRSKSDDDLVNRLAALEGKGAEVHFVFALEGSIYRVIRSKKPRKALMLELHMAIGEWPDCQWKTLSEGKLRETQIAIELLLRMNYDTFINASFLLQGKADEFTTKTPNRRKEILADLLGVSQWDQYKEAAAERRKLEEGRLLLLDGQLGEIETELAEEPERQAALAAAQEEIVGVTARLADKEKLLAQLRRAEAAVQQQKQMIKNLALNLARAQKNLADLEQTRQQRQQERRQHQAILDEAAQILADFAAWQEADAAVQAWQAKADAYNRLQQARRPHEIAVTQERSRLEQRQRELEAQSARVAAAVAERDSVTQRLADGQRCLEQLALALADLAQQEQAWHDARAALQQLESERQLLARELSQLQGQARRMQSIQEEKAAVVKNAEEAGMMLVDLAAQIAAVTQQSHRHAIALGEINNLQVEQERLRAEMNKMKERLDRLQDETEGECPLCGQELSEAHRHAVLAELKAEGAEKGERFRNNRQRLDGLAAEVAGLDAALKLSPRLERDQQAQQQRLAKAEARLAEIDQVVAEWTAGGAARLAELEVALADQAALLARQQQVKELAAAVQKKAGLEKEQREQQRLVANAEARLAEIARTVAEWEEAGQAALAAVQRRLQSGDYALEAQKTLAELDAESAAVGYDNAAHEAARQARQALAHAPDRYQALKQAEAAVKPLEDALADLDRRLAEQAQHVTEQTQQHEAAVAELERLALDDGDLRAVEDEVFRLREEEIAANRRVGAAQQRLAVLDDLRQRRQRLTTERAGQTLLIQRLKLLEKACGRDGVQALLIEQALPEIEERANELLDRLTGGEMYVNFETQKQLKSRDALAETLDIRIIDAAGERPYDNYSGGEQFRVNFAIRLALSQVLARRAGARLQTLVIDEGFGSQDPNGRQRLVEAINTIQDDFTRILIITHIDELRDAFPTRIEVTKDGRGSTISIV